MPNRIGVLVVFLALNVLTSCGGNGTQSASDAENEKLTPSSLTAVWANTGADKVTREELRATENPTIVHNAVWDGNTVSLFGARDEVVGFNLVLEAGDGAVKDVDVRLESLSGPDGTTLRSKDVSGDGVFDWTDRQVELFYTRYLQIKGLSVSAYAGIINVDERPLPERLRRPHDSNGVGTGTWSDRPGANKYYPEIAVPLELARPFEIAGKSNQSVWGDIYIPRDAAVGTYSGEIVITENGDQTTTIPILLEVLDFTLPLQPSLGTMLVSAYGVVNARYLGVDFPNSNTPEADAAKLIHDRHFQMAHRHRIDLVDDNNGPDPWGQDAPRPQWQRRLNGELYTRDNLYEGPGYNTGNGIFPIGLYGTWGWRSGSEADMHAHTDAWENWFAANSPNTERLLYLIDEPGASQLADVSNWLGWMESNPGPGGSLMSFVTHHLVKAQNDLPLLDIPCTVGVGVYYLPEDYQAAVGVYNADPAKRTFFYNGQRPWVGSFATEDDGVALRATSWSQYKLAIDRWFFWASTNYVDLEHGNRALDLFNVAQTFGGLDAQPDSIRGETGHMYGNGDGVLFYPGTDTLFPGDSHGVGGPFASLRLKHWRRGIQDGDYLALARTVDPVATAQIVDQIIPKTLWEYGVDDPGDPTYVHTDQSWPNDPNVWEAARADLVAIILAGN